MAWLGYAKVTVFMAMVTPTKSELVFFQAQYRLSGKAAEKKHVQKVLFCSILEEQFLSLLLCSLGKKFLFSYWDWILTQMAFCGILFFRLLALTKNCGIKLSLNTLST